MKRFVLFNPEAGIYLGNFMGLGFWSLLDAAGQDCAVTFGTAREAIAHRDSWDQPMACEPRSVESREEYATLTECVASGLPGWSLLNEVLTLA